MKIFDSTYVNTYLEQVAANTTELNAEEINQLLRLLKSFDDLFDGTLGYWKTDPVDLELKHYYKPFSSKYYPVPRINKETLCKELERLVKIGVLTPVQKSQYGTSLFIIPKKEGNVRFIRYHFRINQIFFRKPYPLPIIGKKIQHLEGFHNATTLDLNMGYCTIRLLSVSQEMKTIVTEFGKFIYNCLPMAICTSGYIFQAKLGELIGDIEGVKKYIE